MQTVLPDFDGPARPAFHRDEATKLIVPQGSTIEALVAMISDLEGVLGKDNVFIEGRSNSDKRAKESDVPLFEDVYSMERDNVKFGTSVFCTPRHTQDVQVIVRLANKHKVPVWPISRGRNFGYGGRSPRLPGSVVIDLGANMNKIVEINKDDFYCVVEPGVSYFDLHAEVERRGLRDTLWIDCPDLGWGSVLGNMVDRGVGYTPYGDHWSMHCGLEVVLPNGELYRTGMGAMGDKSQCDYVFPYGFGAVTDGLFSQANYGIVVKAGMWLMPNPGGYRPYMITFENEEDLPQIIETIRPLRIKGILPHVAQLRHSLIDIACLNDKAHFFPGKTDIITDEEFKTFIKTKFRNQGFFNYYGALYGPKPLQDASWDIIHAEFSKIKGSKFYFVEDLEEPSLLHHRYYTMQGIPNNAELAWVSWRGKNMGHLCFAPICPTRGSEAVKQYQLCRKLCKEYGFQYTGNFCVGMRDLHHIIDLVYDPSDPHEKEAIQALFRRLVKEHADLGYGEYRTHIFLMDQVAESYSFNENVHLRFQQTIKDALDPNGILAPGKSGIWGKRHREIEGIRLGVTPSGRPELLKEPQGVGKLSAAM